jgi:hypothetical protein
VSAAFGPDDDDTAGFVARVRAQAEVCLADVAVADGVMSACDASLAAPAGPGARVARPISMIPRSTAKLPTVEDPGVAYRRRPRG